MDSMKHAQNQCIILVKNVECKIISQIHLENVTQTQYI